MYRISFILFASLFYSSHSLMCYSGMQIWERDINNVSLIQCSNDQKCCRFVASLNGNRYDCSSNCPQTTSRKCGPDPALGIQDIYYCHCQDHNDEDCKPYLGDKK